ncbi:nuclear transport factor 2 family protein [Micromonospora profundi]|uniref:nuclear transport factor 2 family protein n=1 Tax=Micromonospora profundi TaxID=1420889 RepID=UPI0033B16955
MRRVTSVATALLLIAGVAINPPAASAQTQGTTTNVAVSTTINTLARDVERVESLREVKDVQRAYTHLAQFGRWSEMAELFATDGTLQWGDQTTAGRSAIAAWLEADAGGMDGIRPGSLHTLVIDQPLVNLSADGTTAKGRWMGLRFLGDGEGQARIEGGIYENEYVLRDGRWQIELLRYYPQYAGAYATGWRNVGGALPIVPYHFTPDEAGVPIPPPTGAAPATTATVGELAARISRLNDEDAVRNLQHAYGYYVDRRMWSDVVDLFASDGTVRIDGVGSYQGSSGVRQAMERMGPENLSQGILNERPLFDTIVEVSPNGQEAIARGIEFAMVGDANTRAASWEFSVFRNSFVKDGGLWKLKDMAITPLIVATYADGWGNGGVAAPATVVPAFLDVAGRSAKPAGTAPPNTDLADLKRRLDRSQAFDGAENVSLAYTAYLDDLRIVEMSQIHAANGHKLSPFAGYFIGPERIAQAGLTVYGSNPSTMRNSLSMHWRPQPVVIVSEDGRSATLRARLLQPRTSINNPGTFNGAMYNDEFVLENGIWRVWSLTIDEFYWQSVNWAGGWAAANPRNPSLPDPAPSTLVTRYPPDVLLSQMGIRAEGFQGGTGRFIGWPGILPMWFHYRNPVTGREPAHYWPDCAPCEVRPDWRMTAHGYQKPPTGPQIDGWDLDAPALNKVAPSVNGSGLWEQRLTATPGTWNVDGLSFAYQWLRDGEPISGATGQHYTVQHADVGHELRVKVTATGAGRPAATATSGPVTAAYRTWDAGTVYTGGEYVSHGDAVHVAQWWTQNQAPGSSPWGSWMQVGAPTACATGTHLTWTSSWVYTGGETVVHGGKLWKAQWWTRNQLPGTPNGPWQQVGTC